ncbi:unnamed protein product [Blumeria hordei]|uniref:Uncharacterized protein n=1 Tax=Blumeria hordei TaxID=2867405 RepID=A0A383UZF7_BLUHO|nr:unnamed protein product [Blumeria hordei]
MNQETHNNMLRSARNVANNRLKERGLAPSASDLDMMEVDIIVQMEEHGQTDINLSKVEIEIYAMKGSSRKKAQRKQPQNPQALQLENCGSGSKVDTNTEHIEGNRNPPKQRQLMPSDLHQPQPRFQGRLSAKTTLLTTLPPVRYKNNRQKTKLCWKPKGSGLQTPPLGSTVLNTLESLIPSLKTILLLLNHFIVLPESMTM